jgi:hypothetical protein
MESGKRLPTVARLGRRAAYSGRALAVMAAVAVLATACSKPSGPGVAQLGSTSNAGAAKTGLLAFAECMRAHGISNFPDSGQVDTSSGIDPNSAQFRRAADACRSLLPQGGGGEISTKDQEAFLAHSACMRAHGLPNFPDPNFSGGGAQIQLGPGLDPSSSQFQAAERVCRHLLPGGGPHGAIRGKSAGGGNATTSGG